MLTDVLQEVTASEIREEKETEVTGLGRHVWHCAHQQKTLWHQGQPHSHPYNLPSVTRQKALCKCDLVMHLDMGHYSGWRDEHVVITRLWRMQVQLVTKMFLLWWEQHRDKQILRRYSADFEDGSGPWSKACKQSLQLGKRKEKNSSVEYPEG